MPSGTARARSWGARRWFALAASFAAVLVLGFGAVTVGQLFSPPAAVVALQEIEKAPDAQSASTTLPDGTVATAHWSPSTGRSVLVTDGMPALGSDKTYELWFVRDQTPIAAGTFTPDADGNATAVLDGEMHTGDVIAVTIEPAGGSPTAPRAARRSSPSPPPDVTARARPLDGGGLVAARPPGTTL